MPEIDEPKRRVIDQITRAFDGVSREDGGTLHEAIALDDYATDEQRAEARKLDAETRWQDVPEEDIEHGSLALSFFDPKGFRYYLPAYMIWSLRNYETDEFSTVYSLLFSLGLRLRNPDYHLSRFRLLSPEQSSAVCAFLRYMQGYIEDDWHANTARQALNHHWAQFCAP